MIDPSHSSELQYLLVMLDGNAPSFCHYPDALKDNGPNWIPLQTLRKSIAFARRRKLRLNFLQGTHLLPKAIQSCLQTVEHSLIVPLSRAGQGKNEIVVVRESDLRTCSWSQSSTLQNCILRLEKRALTELGRMIPAVHTHFRRINLCFADLAEFSEEDFGVYREQLRRMRHALMLEAPSSTMQELNIITDRLFLSQMNNCDAGIRHCTLAPDGRFYLCPAFYHEQVLKPLGDLRQGPQLENTRLLQLAHAPICRICDAYHCRRCIYLNQRLTLEINTPSRQQCVVSHLEREASRVLAELLQANGSAGRPISAIQPLDYIDPFEVLSDRANPALPATGNNDPNSPAMEEAQRGAKESSRKSNQSAPPKAGGPATKVRRKSHPAGSGRDKKIV